MSLYVEDKTSHHGPIPFKISESASLFDLKQIVEKKFGVPSAVQKWIIGKSLAKNDEDILRKIGLEKRGGHIFLYITSQGNQVEGSNLLASKFYLMSESFILDTFNKPGTAPQSDVNTKNNANKQGAGIKPPMPKAAPPPTPGGQASAAANNNSNVPPAAAATAKAVPHNRYWNFEKNDWSECNTSDEDEDEGAKERKRAIQTNRAVATTATAAPKEPPKDTPVAVTPKTTTAPKKPTELAPPKLKILNAGGEKKEVKKEGKVSTKTEDKKATNNKVRLID